LAGGAASSTARGSIGAEGRGSAAPLSMECVCEQAQASRQAAMPSVADLLISRAIVVGVLHGQSGAQAAPVLRRLVRGAPSESKKP
jgi:hypothetical protein